MNKLFWLPLAAAVLTAGSAAAQRPLVPGEITRGTLSSSDPVLDNRAHYDEYAFEARRGETIILQMESSAFDTYLRLGTTRRGGGWRELAYDDDGGNGRNSRLQHVVPDDGVYIVRASSLGRSTGAYTLTLSGGRAANGGGYYDDRPQPVRPRPRPRDRDGLVRAGDRIEGYLSPTDPTLDGGEPFHLYTYNGRRGEQLVLDLVSDDFDAYLVLGTPGGRHGVGNVIVRDDDGGGNRNSRIEVVLPDTRVYVIRVNPLGAGRGEYTLEVGSDMQDDYAGPRDDDDDEDPAYSEVDRRLVGRWGLVVPGVRVDPQRWSTVAANAGFGYLDVSEDGRYMWNRNGRTRRGQLEMFAPQRFDAGGGPYYRITDGQEDFYIFFTENRRGERYMQVNSARTDLIAARGYRDPGSR